MTQAYHETLCRFYPIHIIKPIILKYKPLVPLIQIAMIIFQTNQD